VIVSHTEYVDSVHFAHVIGEVKNEGQQSLTLITVTATFYDPQGNVVATAPAPLMMSILVPGQSAPFEGLTNETGLNIARYKVQITNYIQTPEKPTVSLTVHGMTSHVDSVGYMHLLGEVTNNGNSVANLTEVIVTFYNSTGGVVAVAPAATSPFDIPRSQSGTFDALTDVNVNQIASYSVQAEANTLILGAPPSMSVAVNGSVSSSSSSST